MAAWSYSKHSSRWYAPFGGFCDVVQAITLKTPGDRKVYPAPQGGEAVGMLGVMMSPLSPGILCFFTAI